MKITMSFTGTSIAVALAGAVALGMPTIAQAQAAIRLGHSFTEQHPRGQAMLKFAAEVEKATGGAVKISVFPNASLGSEERMLQATQSGVQQFYMGALAPFSVRKKELQIFDFPFLFNNEAEVASVMDGPVGQKMLADLSDTGIEGLSWAGGAFRNVANTKRPIKTFADFKGLKIRVMQSPVAIDSFKAMGMNATPMAYSEVYTALEIGALDGLEHPPVDMYQNKIYEIVKNLAITHHVYTPVALVVNKKWFAGLPPAQQEGIRKAAIVARDYQRAEEMRQEKEAVDMLAAKGMVVTHLPPAELAKMRQAVQPVVDRYSASIGPDFVKSFYAAIEKARKTAN